MQPANLKSLAKPTGNQKSTGPRHVRIEHKSKKNHMHSGEDTSWAVSYSDLLMVLMSFFIMFFSFEAEKPGSGMKVLSQIVQDLKKQNIADQGASAGKDTLPANASTAKSTPPATIKGAVPAGLNQLAKGAGYSIENSADESSVLIQLPDNMYSSRSYKVPQRDLDKIKVILSALSGHQDVISIEIIGHSDRRKVVNKTATITDNIMLSTLRAHSLLDVAANSGLDPGKISIKGSAENERDTRSASIKISVRK